VRRADALAAASDELAHVEVERLEQFPVSVALGVFLEKADEEVLEKRRGLLQLGVELDGGGVHAS